MLNKYRNNDNDNDKLQCFTKSFNFSKILKKNSPGKYALLLYLAISMRWISIMFDAENGGKRRYFRHFYKTNVERYRCESII